MEVDGVFEELLAVKTNEGNKDVITWKCGQKLKY